MIPAGDTQADTFPSVTGDDIRDIEQSWGLIFDGPRRDILLSNESFDVEACPGSGKTTLLVAKLAILAKNWPHSRRGICVLSHTNVARREVESKLVDSAAGQRLLTYPHFVGTIHGFVNEFLALPLLRSEGRPVRLIDDEANGDFCRGLLHNNNAYITARQFLARRETYSPDKTIRGLRYQGAALVLGSAAGNMPCGGDSPSFQQLREIKRCATDRGLWRHDDMFAWASKLLVDYKDVANFIRWRFPAVFIDEMQDTSESQNEILAQLFPAKSTPLRQRYGDPNQAIYDFGQSRAITDPFPSGDIRKVPNSKRFGPSIAKWAEPLAPVSPDPKLLGDGPQSGIIGSDFNASTMPHTIFCFGADSMHRVLPAFGRLMLDVFPDQVIGCDRFSAKAIGRVGQSVADEEKRPRNLGDFWRGYEPRAAKLEPRPQTLADFFQLAQRRRAVVGDCAVSVQLAASGVVELIGRIMPVDVTGKARSMKWLRDVMGNDAPALRAVQHILWKCCVEMDLVSEQGWPNQVAAIREAVRPVIGDEWPLEAEKFCKWSAEFAGERTDDVTTNLSAPNRYRFTDGGRVVEIDVGTIHSVKGQTHTATLVMETFFKTHDLGDLLPWLTGSGFNNDGLERLERRRLIYTAMTRPTHLLCLAMRDKALGEGPSRDAKVNYLEGAGWKMTYLS